MLTVVRFSFFIAIIFSSVFAYEDSDESDSSFHTAHSSFEQNDSEDPSFSPFHGSLLDNEDFGDDDVSQNEKKEPVEVKEEIQWGDSHTEVVQTIMDESKKLGFWQDPLFKARVGIILALIGTHVLHQWMVDHDESLEEFLKSLYGGGAEFFDSFISWAQSMWEYIPNMELIQDLITELPAKIWDTIPSAENLWALAMSKWDNSAGQVIYNLWNSPEKMNKAYAIFSKLGEGSANVLRSAWKKISKK